MICLPASVGLVGPTGGVAGPAYWSPTLKSSLVTLSETGNRLMTNSNASWRGVLSVTAHTTGKHYAEVQRVGTTPWAHIFGLAKPTASVEGYAGQDSDGWGLQTDNGSSAAAMLHSAAATGVTVTPQINNSGYARVAYDAATGNAWIGNETAWAGGGDPAAGTSPTFTVTAGTAMHVMGSDFGESARLRTDTADFVGTIPTGFSAWG